MSTTLTFDHVFRYPYLGKLYHLSRVFRDQTFNDLCSVFIYFQHAKCYSVTFYSVRSPNGAIYSQTILANNVHNNTTNI